jgi:hypothetical protein
MKKRLFSLLTVLLVATVMTSTASAGGNVGLSKLQFSLGSQGGMLTMAAASQNSSFSLSATGTLTGLGGYQEGVTANIVASGIPVVTCTNQGGNQAVGQNAPKVTASDDQFIGPQDITKKGTAPLGVTAEPEPITGTQGGCPNDNWTAQIVNVLWTNGIISVRDTATNDLLLEREFTCDPRFQTATSVICTAAR